MNSHACRWEGEKNKDDTPAFRINRQMSSDPLIHVTCKVCNTRTWLSEDQWSRVNKRGILKDG